jgi:glycosyltransferase involved in cell wall biosynthesis
MVPPNRSTPPGRPTVGVVIPVHNGAAYLGEALDSLVAQRLPPDRVVVVDDASTDGSVDAARRFAGLLPLEIVRRPVRGGVSAARNAGIAVLDTNLVALLDADDVWSEEHLERAVDAYVRRGGLVSPAAELWYPDGSSKSFQRWLGLRTPRDSRQLRALLRRNFVFVGALLPRSEVLAVGGFRPPDIGEDWDLWIRLVARGLPVTQLRGPTVRYRRHGGNTTAERAGMIPPLVTVLERARTELGAAYDADLRRSIERHLAELRWEEELLGLGDGARPSWTAVRSGLRAPARVRLKVVLRTLSPYLWRRLRRSGVS